MLGDNKQNMDGTGVGRDAFNLLQKAAQEGKVLSFIVLAEYSPRYRQELGLPAAGPGGSGGTNGMFGNVIDLTTLAMRCCKQIVKRTYAEDRPTGKAAAHAIIKFVAEGCAAESGGKAILVVDRHV